MDTSEWSVGKYMQLKSHPSAQTAPRLGNIASRLLNHSQHRLCFKFHQKNLKNQIMNTTTTTTTTSKNLKLRNFSKSSCDFFAHTQNDPFVLSQRCYEPKGSKAIDGTRSKNH